MIERPDYLATLTPYVDQPLIKILCGVRRSGKSTILEMVGAMLARGVKAECIVSRNYAHMPFDGWSAKEMFDDLSDRIVPTERCYLLLDEVQEIDGWEKVVNTLQETGNVDVYVTGSNSKLMSSEISTYLTGRYVSVPVYTLSFEEYLTFKGKTRAEARSAFDDYLRFGGFPLIALNAFEERSAYQIVEDIYAAVVTRDISKRHNIANKELFDRVVRFVVENVGKTFSANSIVTFLKNERRAISVESVYNYLKWLGEALIVYPCSRYDIQGRAVLKTQGKYYLSDVSFKYALFGFGTKMVAALLENIVFLELKRRGYDVYIGKNGEKEIDFVAAHGADRIYVQVCRNLPEESDREMSNLLEIKDNHPKYLVTLDPYAQGNESGVQIRHIADFLLERDW